jgi:hypothetical protein
MSDDDDEFNEAEEMDLKIQEEQKSSTHFSNING